MPSAFDWVDKKVLVTGGTGMLGSSLVPDLSTRKALVHVFARSNQAVPGAHESVVCDLNDFDALRRGLDGGGYDVVLHLAGQSQATKADPRSTFDTNVGGTLNLLEAIRDTGSEAAVVITSTCAVTPGLRALLEPSDTQDAVQPYDASKLCAELIATCYLRSYALNVGIVRLPNLFGPHDRNLRRLVPGTICAALAGSAPVIRSDPSTVLNFLYVEEAVQAILRFAARIAEGRQENRTVAIRNPQSITLGAMLDEILTRMDRRDLLPEIASGPASPIEQDASPFVGAAEEWSWEPEIPLPEALDRTIDWYRQNYSA